MINTIAVCGAGTMGSGIAQVSALSGFQTILFDVKTDMLISAKSAIAKSLQANVGKGRLSTAKMEEAISRLEFASDMSECKADVIIEAIVEKIDAKTALFKELLSINSPQTIIASNTSSLSITDIAAELTNASNFVGMHFFNPAPVMQLVEIVKGDKTSDTTVEAIYNLAKAFNKTPVICKDAPGFIVNRVARPYYLEAMQLAQNENVGFETIDRIMEARGFKMGPFKLMDLIGLDINYSVSEIVWNALGKPARLTPSELQKQKVDSKQLGKKSGKGFYNYS